MSRLDNFSQYIESAMQSWYCPGVAVAIVRGDEVLHQAAYGLRDVEQQLPMTIDTRFAMASVTKSFAAMTIAQLVDDGKLEWDQPVREYMPEFILNDPYATQHITIRDMLCHRSGLPRHDWSAWRLDIELADYLKRMKNFKFSTSFREKFQYNNLMYYMTAYVVEKLTDKHWEDFVQERIFDPLGMTASNFKPEPPQADQLTAWGYRVERDPEGTAKELVRTVHGQHSKLSPGAAGALFSTLADLTQWLKAHVNGGQVGDVRIVSTTNLKQMHLPQMVVPVDGMREALMGNTIETYGMGWFIEPYRGYTLVQHGGNVEGCSLMIGFVPQESIGVVALTNIGMVPLRDVLLYEGLDRALDLSDKDWNTRFHNMFDPIFASMSRSKTTTAEEKVADAPTSHPIEDYLGIYVAEGYPEFAVRRTDEGQLQARNVDSTDWSTFNHYHYDVFNWHWPDLDTWFKVRFLTNDNGEINAVSIPIEPMVENVTYTRKALDIPADVVKALVGEYTPPIEGMVVTVTAHDKKLSVAIAGQPAEEMQPYKLTEDVVGFRVERARFDFMREDGRIKELVIKNVGMTLVAPRKDTN